MRNLSGSQFDGLENENRCLYRGLKYDGIYSVYEVSGLGTYLQTCYASRSSCERF